MELNENTYEYISKVFFQLEGITCALATLVENCRLEVSSYHYRVLNDTYNDMRNEYIESVRWITDEFEPIKQSAIKMVDIMRGSAESKTRLEEACEECSDCISRWIIRCNNIAEINESTENPYIPYSDEEVYKIFVGYKGLLDDYPIQYPDNEDDVISNLFFSFFKTCYEKYDSLFKGYNETLEQLGLSVETKRLVNEKQAHEAAQAILQKKKKNDAIKNIACTVVGLGITTAEALVPVGLTAAAISSAPLAGIAAVGIATKAATAFGIIEKKDLGDVATEGIGLIATISKDLKDIIPGDENNKSAARSLLRSFETYDQAIKMADEASGVFDSDTSSAEKLLFGTVLAATNGQQIAKMKENGTADVLTLGLNLTGAAIETIKSVIEGDYKAAVLSGLQMPNKVIKLVESAAESIKKNEMANMVPLVGKMLYKYGDRLERYNNAVEKYDYNMARGFPAIKPKKPLWVLEGGCEIVGKISEKINKNGDDIIEFIKSVL